MVGGPQGPPRHPPKPPPRPSSSSSSGPKVPPQGLSQPFFAASVPPPSKAAEKRPGDASTEAPRSRPRVGGGAGPIRVPTPPPPPPGGLRYKAPAPGAPTVEGPLRYKAQPPSSAPATPPKAPAASVVASPRQEVNTSDQVLLQRGSRHLRLRLALIVLRVTGDLKRCWHGPRRSLPRRAPVRGRLRRPLCS